MKLLLSDDRIGMLPLEAALLGALSALFEQLWQRAIPLRLPGDATGIAGTPLPPNPDELELMALMVAGLTDGAMARKLVVLCQVCNGWLVLLGFAVFSVVYGHGGGGGVGVGSG